MSELILQISLNGLLLAMLYVLVALGLTLLFSIMNILNFAHAEMLMLAAFISYYVIERFPMAQSGLANFAFAVILGILLVGAVGIILERIFFRPLRGRVLEMLIMSVGLGVAIQCGGYIAFGIMDKSVSINIPGSLTISQATLPATRVLIIIASAILVSMLFYIVHRTKLGMAMRAIEQDSETAVMLGIRINHVNLFAFVIACALAGAAGVLISLVFVVNPVMGSEFLLKAFVVIILGGAGGIIGCVAGSLLLGFADSITGTLFGAHIAYGIGFALIIIVLLVKPTGLVGHAQK